MKIDVDVSEMYQKSNDILVIRDDLRKNMDQIEMLVLSVNGVWQSESEKAYASKIVSVKKQFSGISDFLTQYSELLSKLASKYDDFDITLSEKINLA